MQIHFGVELLRAEWTEAVVCIGTFDGVHLGHQAVIKAAVDEARSHELPCVLVTFDRHPAATLAPERCPKAVASLATNLAGFAALGVAIAVVLPFDRPLSETSAEDFLREILLGKIRARRIVVGHDFALGNGRKGTPEWLSERIATTVVPPFEMNGRRVSSSDVRRAVESGEVEQAAQWLGRFFEIPGVVVGGQRLGRELGYPTANLARSFDGVVPAHGVYAGQARLDETGESFRAAISIGVRPAVGGGSRTIEAYLLDYPGGDLYGRSIDLGFLRRLREELDFATLDALKEQIGKDVQAVRAT